MKPGTKQKLIEAYIWCDENEKSTEFLLQYLQDTAGVDLDCVLKFIQDIPPCLVIKKETVSRRLI